MPDIFLYPGEPNRNDIRLRSPVAGTLYTISLVVVSAVTTLLSRQVGKPLTVTSPTVSQIVKFLTKSLTVVSASNTSLLAQRVTLVVLSVISPALASMARVVGKPLTASSASVASVVKGVRKSLTVISGSTASMTKLRSLALTASSAAVASIARVTGKTLATVSPTTTTLRRGISKTLSVTSAVVPSLVGSTAQVLTKALSVVSHAVASLVAIFFPKGTKPPPVLLDMAVATLAVSDALSMRATLVDSARGAIALADQPQAFITLDDFLSTSDSYGPNLVANDHAQLGTNANWPQYVYDAINQHLGHASFRNAVFNDSEFSTALMPIDPTRRYYVNYWAESTTHIVGAHAYLGLAPYDLSGQPITSQYVMWLPNTLTTLAADLHPGDPTITLTSAANWHNGTTTYQRTILIWDYIDSAGHLWAPSTYTRHHPGYDIWPQGAIVGNVITLRTPWVGFGSVIPAGTPVSNASAGGTYMYCCAVNVDIPAIWTPYPGIVTPGSGAGGYDNTGTAPSNRWWPGTTQVKMMQLLNRDLTGNVTNITDVELRQIMQEASAALVDLPRASLTLSDFD